VEFKQFMPRLSTLEYQAFLARRAAPEEGSPLSFRNNSQRTHGVARESDLRRQVLDYCSSQGWLVFTGSTAHRTYRTVGEPDMIVLMPDRRFLMVELKTDSGKRSLEQVGVHAWAQKLGHTIHIVRSIKEFIDATSLL
jgi:hypothetical protein